MFDVAPTEMLVVAIVALLVIGPKDLPKALRFVGKWVGKARGMARHFRSGIDTMMRETELADMEQKWREHNDSIMRAYPDVAVGPVLPPASDAVAAPMLPPSGEGVPAAFPEGFSGADLMGPAQPVSTPASVAQSAPAPTLDGAPLSPQPANAAP
ncbi:MAG: Sec-independent protein translocase protein TatB [Pseudomonadota bacterium]